MTLPRAVGGAEGVRSYGRPGDVYIAGRLYSSWRCHAPLTGAEGVRSYGRPGDVYIAGRLYFGV